MQPLLQRIEAYNAIEVLIRSCKTNRGDTGCAPVIMPSACRPHRQQFSSRSIHLVLLLKPPPPDEAANKRQIARVVCLTWHKTILLHAPLVRLITEGHCGRALQAGYVHPRPFSNIWQRVIAHGLAPQQLTFIHTNL